MKNLHTKKTSNGSEVISFGWLIQQMSVNQKVGGICFVEGLYQALFSFRFARRNVIYKAKRKLSLISGYNSLIQLILDYGSCCLGTWSKQAVRPRRNQFTEAMRQSNPRQKMRHIKQLYVLYKPAASVRARCKLINICQKKVKEYFFRFYTETAGKHETWTKHFCDEQSDLFVLMNEN